MRGPQVTVEQQVASNLTLTYSTNVSVSSQQIIQAEYNITRNISIVALRDQNGVVSFDLRIRSRSEIGGICSIRLNEIGQQNHAAKTRVPNYPP